MSKRTAKRAERREHKQKLNSILTMFRDEIKYINCDDVRKENKMIKGVFDKYNNYWLAYCKQQGQVSSYLMPSVLAFQNRVGHKPDKFNVFTYLINQLKFW